MASWASPKKNHTSGMASWPWRKIIIHREWPAGPGENKIYIGNGRLAKPPNSIEDQWETAFPLCEQSTKNYTSATDEKIYIGIWPGPSENQLQPLTIKTLYLFFGAARNPEND